VQRQEPALEETRNSEVTGFFSFILFPYKRMLFYLLKKNVGCSFSERLFATSLNWLKL
jgi:hypothetical protein